MDSVRVLVPSPKGGISASWQRAGNRIVAELGLPPKVRARIELPGLAQRQSGPGLFRFEVSEAEPAGA
jgi:hypothetical protein